MNGRNDAGDNTHHCRVSLQRGSGNLAASHI
jgi:hypothetical protein